jgi:GAF domain-containing protein
MSPAPSGQTALLQSVVDVARAIFGAQAASILLHEPGAAELTFAAVSGEGSGTLVGRRIPLTTGVAGWVFATRQPLAIEDVSSDPRFAGDVASSTGYVPKGIMAAPLLNEDRALGVISVLDRPRRVEFSLIEMDLLGAFAHLAAQALDLAATARAATGPVARLQESLNALEGPRRAAATRLVEALGDVLEEL